MRLSRRVSALFVLGFVTGCSGSPDTGDGTSPDSGVDSAHPIDTGVQADTADTASPDTAPEAGDAGDDGAPDGMTSQACNQDDDCTAADLCTNARKCVGGKCAVIGGVPSCDDGVACTTDACDATAGACTHTGDDTKCGSGRFCDPKLGCSDVLPCTGASDATCDRLNDDACKGTFSCNPTSLRCERAAAPVCKGPDACTPAGCLGTKTSYMCQSGIGPDYTSDPLNCGGCMQPCPTRANAGATCASATCTWTCALGSFDVDGDLNVARSAASNGCECKKSAMADKPDLAFVDDNCDGIDGDVTKAIFVSPLGSDSSGDGTMTKPVQTIAKALTLASAAGKDVYADKGSFSVGTLALKSGVGIYGGYDSSKKWARSLSNETKFNGGVTAISGTGLTANLELQLIHVVAADAKTAGASSYGVYLFNSPAVTVSVVGCTIDAGAGALGANGTAGTSGTPGANGSGQSAGGSTCGASGGAGGSAQSGQVNGGNGAPGTTAPVAGAGVFGSGGGGSAGQCGGSNPTNGNPGIAGSIGAIGSEAGKQSMSLGAFTTGCRSTAAAL